MAEQRGVEPGARFFHGFVRVVSGEHDAVHTQLADRVEQRAGVEVATGGDVEVVAEILADRSARVAQANPFALLVEAVLKTRQQEGQALAEVTQDDWIAGY